MNTQSNNTPFTISEYKNMKNFFILQIGWVFFVSVACLVVILLHIFLFSNDIGEIFENTPLYIILLLIFFVAVTLTFFSLLFRFYVSLFIYNIYLFGKDNYREKIVFKIPYWKKILSQLDELYLNNSEKTYYQNFYR